ncbi:hypothetical protein CRUP_013289 [Coryphaenoides rupestris]|nr:hypothetical protein CRUP_013289 [Coryphaenoides rupestris]
MRSAEEVKLRSGEDAAGGPHVRVYTCQRSPALDSRWGKAVRWVVCGQASVGKTAILEQLLYGNHTVGAVPLVQLLLVLTTSRKPVRPKRTCTWPRVETDRGVKEQLRLYDTRGLHEELDLPKHYYLVADGFVLVYSVDSLESFRKVDILKKEIDKSRDQKGEL